MYTNFTQPHGQTYKECLPGSQLSADEQETVRGTYNGLTVSSSSISGFEVADRVDIPSTAFDIFFSRDPPS